MANRPSNDELTAALIERFGDDFDAMKAAIRESVMAVPDEIAEAMAAADDEDEARRVLALALHRAMAAALGEDVMRLLDGHSTQ